MALGSTLDTAHDAMIERLNPWIKNPPDYTDVSEAYKKRGQLLSKRSKLIRQIDYIEDSIVLESDKPRSTETRVAKLTATKDLRDQLADLDADIAIIDNQIKLYEYHKDMYKVANYQLKNVMDL